MKSRGARFALLLSLFSLTFAEEISVTTLRPDCLLEFPDAVFNVSSLGLVRGNVNKVTYFVNLCSGVDVKNLPNKMRTEKYCASMNVTPVLQVTDAECPRLSNQEGHAALKLEDAVGFSLRYPGGGTPCGSATGPPRSADVFVACADGISKIVSVDEPSQCSYKVKLVSRAGCPLICERDPAGAVCGGSRRGDCTATGCVCKEPHVPPFCETLAEVSARKAKQEKIAAARVAAAARGPVSSMADVALSPTRRSREFTLAFFAGGAFVIVLLAVIMYCRVDKSSHADAFSTSGASAPSPLASPSPREPLGWTTRNVFASLAALGFVLFLGLEIRFMDSLIGTPLAVHNTQMPTDSIVDSHVLLAGLGFEEEAVKAVEPTTAAVARPPLLVIYGDIPLYWGNYAVKHFIVTTDLLKTRGWGEYIPRVNDPRDTWEEMLTNMREQFDGRIPDVILFLQDHELFNPEKFPLVAEFANTQRLCWFDDTTRNPPSDMGYSLGHASLLLPTYEYLHKRLPEAARAPRVWTPHSALPNFELAYNPAPKRLIMLVGMVMSGYPLRELINEMIVKYGDKRLTQYRHPGWHPGPGLSHIDAFAAALNEHLACIMDASSNNFVISKIFEVPATGSLLLITDDIADAMAALHFVDGVNYVSFNRTTLNATLDWVLDPANALTVDKIRAAGQKVVHDHHSTRVRVDSIHAAGLEAARVKATLDAGGNATYDLKKIARFPNYEDWAWKDPRSADFYAGKALYRRNR